MYLSYVHLCYLLMILQHWETIGDSPSFNSFDYDELESLAGTVGETIAQQNVSNLLRSYILSDAPTAEI